MMLEDDQRDAIRRQSAVKDFVTVADANQEDEAAEDADEEEEPLPKPSLLPPTWDHQQQQHQENAIQIALGRYRSLQTDAFPSPQQSSAAENGNLQLGKNSSYRAYVNVPWEELPQQNPGVSAYNSYSMESALDADNNSNSGPPNPANPDRFGDFFSAFSRQSSEPSSSPAPVSAGSSAFANATAAALAALEAKTGKLSQDGNNNSTESGGRTRPRSSSVKLHRMPTNRTSMVSNAAAAGNHSGQNASAQNNNSLNNGSERKASLATPRRRGASITTGVPPSPVSPPTTANQSPVPKSASSVPAPAPSVPAPAPSVPAPAPSTSGPVPTQREPLTVSTVSSPTSTNQPLAPVAQPSNSTSTNAVQREKAPLTPPETDPVCRYLPADENLDSAQNVGGVGKEKEFGAYPWNARFQEAFELPETTQEDVVRKYKLMTQLSDDFVSTSLRYGKVIVMEQFLPEDRRTLKCQRLGGVAGGAKYVIQGILYKLSNDPVIVETEQGKGYLYGKNTPRLEYAAKAAAHDLKGAISYFQVSWQHHQTRRKKKPGPTPLSPTDPEFSRAPSRRMSMEISDQDEDFVRVPMQCVIDYLGYRLTSMPLLPIGGPGATIIYGSANSGVDVHASDPYVCSLMEQYANYLHLAAHPVNNVTLHSAGDVEAHRGADNRVYLVDLARAFPAENPEVSTHLQPYGSAVFYRLLRPEFLQHLKKNRFPPLSPDALTGWGLQQMEVHNPRLNGATRYLVYQHIPTFAAETGTKVKLTNPVSVTLHQAGINVRHIGLIRSLLPFTQSKAKITFMDEVVSPALSSASSSVAASTASVANSASPPKGGEKDKLDKVEREKSEKTVPTTPTTSNSAGSGAIVSPNSANNSSNSAVEPVRESSGGIIKTIAEHNREVLLIEIVARTLKQLLRSALRFVVRREAFGEFTAKECIINFLNLVTGAMPEFRDFWVDEVTPGIMQRFGQEALTEEEQKYLFWCVYPHLWPVMSLLLEMSKIALSESLVAQCREEPFLFKFTCADIIEIDARAKHLDILDLAKGRLLLHMADRESDQAPRAAMRLLSGSTSIFSRSIARSLGGEKQTVAFRDISEARMHEITKRYQVADELLLSKLQDGWTWDPTYYRLILRYLLEVWEARREKSIFLHLKGASSLQSLKWAHHFIVARNGAGEGSMDWMEFLNKITKTRLEQASLQANSALALVGSKKGARNFDDISIQKRFAELLDGYHTGVLRALRALQVAGVDKALQLKKGSAEDAKSLFQNCTKYLELPQKTREETATQDGKRVLQVVFGFLFDSAPTREQCEDVAYLVLDRALLDNECEIIGVLQEMGLDIDKGRFDKGSSTLMVAAERGEEGIVAALLNARASLDMVNSEGHDALFLTELSHQSAVLSMLLKSKAPQGVRDHYARVCLDIVRAEREYLKLLSKSCQLYVTEDSEGDSAAESKPLSALLMRSWSEYFKPPRQDLPGAEEFYAVYKLHTALLRDFEANPADLIPVIFTEYLPHLSRVYSTYLKGLFGFISATEKPKKKVDGYLRKVEKDHQLAWVACLDQPRTRLFKYLLYLKELLIYTHAAHPQYGNIKHVITELGGIAHDFEEQRLQTLHSDTMVSLLKKLSGPEVSTIDPALHELRMEGVVLWLSHRVLTTPTSASSAEKSISTPTSAAGSAKDTAKKGSELRLYLFSDFLLWTTMNYHTVGSLRLDDCKVLMEKKSNIIAVENGKGRLEFECNDHYDVAAWASEMAKTIKLRAVKRQQKARALREKTLLEGGRSGPMSARSLVKTTTLTTSRFARRANYPGTKHGGGVSVDVQSGLPLGGGGAAAICFPRLPPNMAKQSANPEDSIEEERKENEEAKGGSTALASTEGAGPPSGSGAGGGGGGGIGGGIIGDALAMLRGLRHKGDSGPGEAKSESKPEINPSQPTTQ